MKLLLGIPSPFDFTLVEKHQKHLQIDKIIPRYYREDVAYKLIRDYFLKHKQYTHLVIACSDIVVNQNHIWQLERDLQDHDYPVITGIMNICLEFLNVYNITSNVVHPQMPEFNWYVEDTLPKENIFRVNWSGFPLMCIRRDIVERFDFEPINLYLKDKNLLYGSLDVVLCFKFFKENIPIYADKRIKLLHLKEVQEKSQETKVGKKPAKLIVLLQK